MGTGRGAAGGGGGSGGEGAAVPGAGFYDIDGALAREAGGRGGPAGGGAGGSWAGARGGAGAGAGGGAGPLRGSREHVQLWRGRAGAATPLGGPEDARAAPEHAYDNEGDAPDWIDWENNSGLSGMWTYEELLALDEGVASSRGLSPAQLSALPVMPAGGPAAPALGGLECSICLETFSDGQDITVLPCDHTFHAQCLKTWARKSGACPCCRNAIIAAGAPVC